MAPTKAPARLPHFRCRLLPFRAVRFAPEHTSDLGHLVVPVDHHANGSIGRSAYGVTREVHPLHSRQLFPQPDEYSPTRSLPRTVGRRLGSLFRQWQAEGHLLLDEDPSLYLHDLHFEQDTRPLVREGFYAMVALDPDGTLRVLPHEQTLISRVKRQLDIYAWRGAQILPLLLLYSDPSGEVLGALREGIGAEAPLEFSDGVGQSSRLWRISDPGATSRALAALEGKPLVIADGHHRFEAGRELWRRTPQRPPSPSLPAGEGGADAYMVAYLTPLEGAGLRLGPFHRGVTRLQGLLDARLAAMSSRYVMEPFSLPSGDEGAGVIAARLDALGEDGIVLIASRGRRAFTVRLPPADPGDVYISRLTVTRVHQEILPAIGIQGAVWFDQNIQPLFRGVVNGALGAAVFLHPPTARQVWDVAQEGWPMPPKATFFYPKVQAGLIQFPFGFSRTER